MTREVFDANGRGVTLMLRHSEETDAALTTLQNVDGSTIRAVLGALRIGSRGLFVEPITLWTAGKPIHLTLDSARHVAVASSIAAARQVTADGDDEPEDAEGAEAEVDEPKTPVGRLLSQVQFELLAIAEGGVGVLRDLSPLCRAAAELHNVGLSSCAAACQRVCDALEQHRKSLSRSDAPAGEAILRCTYIVHLAGECETVAVAVA